MLGVGGMYSVYSTMDLATVSCSAFFLFPFQLEKCPAGGSGGGDNARPGSQMGRNPGTILRKVIQRPPGYSWMPVGSSREVPGFRPGSSRI
jgi:hypothetical protein